MIDPASVLTAIAMRLGVSGATALAKKALPRAAEPMQKATVSA